MEAEGILAQLPNVAGNEDLYYLAQRVIVGEDAARKLLKKRVKALREAEARQHAEQEQAAAIRGRIRGRK